MPTTWRRVAEESLDSDSCAQCNLALLVPSAPVVVVLRVFVPRATKIRHLGMPRRREEDVFGLDVPAAVGAGNDRDGDGDDGDMTVVLTMLAWW